MYKYAFQNYDMRSLWGLAPNDKWRSDGRTKSDHKNLLHAVAETFIQFIV